MTAPGIVIDVVAKATGLRTGQIVGPSRYPAEIARARHVAAYLMHVEGYSLPAIARALKRRNHTTILNSLERVEADRELCGLTARLIGELP